MLIEIKENEMKIYATQRQIGDAISLLHLELLSAGVNQKAIKDHVDGLICLFNDLGYESARAFVAGALCKAPIDSIISEAMKAFSPKEEENENRNNRQ